MQLHAPVRDGDPSPRHISSGATRTARASPALAYMTSPVQRESPAENPRRPHRPVTRLSCSSTAAGSSRVLRHSVPPTDGIPFDWQEALIDAGWAVASAEYVLSLETPFYNEGVDPPVRGETGQDPGQVPANQRSIPRPRRDKDRAGRHVGGRSDAAMALSPSGDTATYTLVQNGAPNGQCGFGKTSNYAQEVQVNYKTFGSYGGTSLTRMVTDGTEPDLIAGLMLYAAPIDMTGLPSPTRRSTSLPTTPTTACRPAKPRHVAEVRVRRGRLHARHDRHHLRDVPARPTSRSSTSAPGQARLSSRTLSGSPRSSMPSTRSASTHPKPKSRPAPTPTPQTCPAPASPAWSSLGPTTPTPCSVPTPPTL